MQMQDRSPKDRSPRPYSFHQAQWYGPQRRTWCEQFPDGPIPHGHLGKSPSFRSRPLRVCLASLERPPFLLLTATGRNEVLLQIARRHRSRDRNEQRLSANFGSDLLQHLRHGLGLDRQQNDVGAFDRFAIVGGYGDRSEEHTSEL